MNLLEQARDKLQQAMVSGQLPSNMCAEEVAALIQAATFASAMLDMREHIGILEKIRKRL